MAAGASGPRARKCTVEPVIGIVKEVLGFRQFSLRGAEAAAGAAGKSNAQEP